MSRIFDLDLLKRVTPSFIGRIEELEKMFDDLTSDPSGAFPSHDIIKHKHPEGSQETYEIVIALAGFKKEDVDIKIKGNNLKITGNNKSNENDKIEYLYSGIAKRSFNKTFTLSSNVKIVGAKMEDGMLRITLVKEIPEEMKTREIEIS